MIADVEKKVQEVWENKQNLYSFLRELAMQANEADGKVPKIPAVTGYPLSVIAVYHNGTIATIPVTDSPEETRDAIPRYSADGTLTSNEPYNDNDVATKTYAEKIFVDGNAYIGRIGTEGAAGYITFVLEEEE